jgi:hypothetical protein
MSSSDCLTSLVEAGVERNAVLPAPPDDPDPGPGEDADGVRMAAASGDRTSVDVVSPGVGHPAAVCEIHHCGSEFLVARPPEHDLFTFAGLLVDGDAPARAASASSEGNRSRQSPISASRDAAAPSLIGAG